LLNVVDDELLSVDMPTHGEHIRKQTTGVLDLGGASLQIAFELPDKHVVTTHSTAAVSSALNKLTTRLDWRCIAS